MYFCKNTFQKYFKEISQGLYQKLQKKSQQFQSNEPGITIEFKQENVGKQCY